jgi:CubicO group peptidase (beta-lactamase class C family)
MPPSRDGQSPNHAADQHLVHPRLSRRRLLTRLAAASVPALVSLEPGALAGSQAATPATGPAGPGQPPPGEAMPHSIERDASSRFRSLAERLMAAMVEHKIPGAALGILADGQEEHGVFGVTSVETKQPVTADTLFQIGSLSKVYTGTAVMRLIGQAKLDLDATVRTYLPEFRVLDQDVAARVTVRHLLTHTGGWWGDDSSAAGGSGDDAIARNVAEKLPTLPQLFPLGAFFSYNNAGFTVLGRLIEVATGKSFRTAMRDLVLAPLGMSGSTYVPEEVRQKRYAAGHDQGPKGTELVTPLFLPRAMDPAGGLWSTTREQLLWARFHMGDGRTPEGARLLAPHALALMRTAQVPIPGIESLAMGMNWFVQDHAGVRLAFHNGDTFGQHTVFLFAPGRRFALVLLTNGQPGGGQAELAVLNEALQRYLGLGLAAAQGGLTAAISAPAGTPTVAVLPDRLAQYSGRYSTPGSAVVVRPENGRLLLSVEEKSLPDQIMPSTPSPPVKDLPLPFVAEDLVRMDTVLVPFVRKPNGEVGWTGVGLRLTPRTAPS